MTHQQAVSLSPDHGPANLTEEEMTMSNDPAAAAPWWLILTALTGSISGLFGIYWDEAWHTDIGRDTFWSPPHLFIYGGIAAVGLAVAVWTWIGLRSGKIRRPMVIAISGALLTIASGPIDEWWHVAFGRDAVVWSPPHMAALVGVILLVGSLLIEGARFPGRSGRAFATLASAGLLAAVLIAVYEYEGDVPQFPVVLYLPLLAGLSSLAFAMIRRVRQGVTLPATRAAAAYTGLMIGVVAILALLGHSLPVFTIILGPAIVFDLAGRRRSQVVRAVLFSASLFALYVPYLNLVQRGVYIPAGDVAAGLPAAVAISWGALIAVEGVQRIPRRAAVAVTTMLLLMIPGTALAHDPGFGDDVAEVRLDAEVIGTTAVITGQVGGADCPSLEAIRLVGRRAGRTMEGDLSVSKCTLSGSVELPDRGRWFIYTELVQDGAPLEAWIAANVGSSETAFQRDTTLYLASIRTSPLSKYMVGLALYAVALGALVYMVRTVHTVGRAIPAANADRT